MNIHPNLRGSVDEDKLYMASSPTKSGRVEDQPNMEITPTKSPCNQQIHTHKESKGYMHKFRLNICRDVVCENHEYKGSSLTQHKRKVKIEKQKTERAL